MCSDSVGSLLNPGITTYIISSKQLAIASTHIQQQWHLFNPFNTMRFQHFALVSTGMRGTHVHLPMTQI